MSTATSIQWTDKTWNPVRGCSIVSPGCVNCYAMKFAHRFSGEGKAYAGLTKQTKAGPQWTGQIRMVPEALSEPRRWRKPARVFVNSMSDLFHPGVDDAFIARVFEEMALAPRHTFQVLTKRPDRMLDVVSALAAVHTAPDGSGWPLPNVWLGVSVENQDQLGRIDILKDVPAAIRFVSFEPLLEDLGALVLDGIHWAIVGGESGPGARNCEVEWIASIVQQCESQGVAPFVKQLGSRPTAGRRRYMEMEIGTSALHLNDSKGGDMAEWPIGLRVREFPA